MTLPPTLAAAFTFEQPTRSATAATVTSAIDLRANEIFEDTHNSKARRWP